MQLISQIKQIKQLFKDISSIVSNKSSNLPAQVGALINFYETQDLIVKNKTFGSMESINKCRFNNEAYPLRLVNCSIYIDNFDSVKSSNIKLENCFVKVD